jgi:NTE family protein
MKHGKKIGLSLSGGGYRAAAFHLGTLKKLNELGLLDKIDVISTISGGSIIGAYYCLQNQSFDQFEKKVYETLNRKSVIKHILESRAFVLTVFLFLLFLTACYLFIHFLSAWLLLLFIPFSFYLIGRFQFRIFPVSSIIEAAYDRFFYEKATLSKLKDKPELAIGTTNLQTCRPFTFSKRKMEDSTYAYMKPPVMFKNQDFPVARAVAASTCVPNFFTPVRIAPAYFSDPKDIKRACPVLVDGGVYDNQGIQKLTQPGSSYECDIVITSDAGNKLPFEGSYNNTLILLMRTVEAFMARIKNFQMAQHLYSGSGKVKNVAYYSLGWEIKNCIGGFLSGLKNGHINEATLRAHGIPVSYYHEPEKFASEILSILSDNVRYSYILSNDLTTEELAIANNVKTNLTPLSATQLNALIKHAGNLTELQIRLYCPELVAVE